MSWLKKTINDLYDMADTEENEKTGGLEVNAKNMKQFIKNIIDG